MLVLDFVAFSYVERMKCGHTASLLTKRGKRCEKKCAPRGFHFMAKAQVAWHAKIETKSKRFDEGVFVLFCRNHSLLWFDAFEALIRTTDQPSSASARHDAYRFLSNDVTAFVLAASTFTRLRVCVSKLSFYLTVVLVTLRGGSHLLRKRRLAVVQQDPALTLSNDWIEWDGRLRNTTPEPHSKQYKERCVITHTHTHTCTYQNGSCVWGKAFVSLPFAASLRSVACGFGRARKTSTPATPVAPGGMKIDEGSKGFTARFFPRSVHLPGMLRGNWWQPCIFLPAALFPYLCVWVMSFTWRHALSCGW